MLGVLATLAVPTYTQVRTRSELSVAELSLANLSRYAFTLAAFEQGPLDADHVTEAVTTTPLTSAAPGVHAAAWSLDLTPGGHSTGWGAAHAAISAPGDTLGIAVQGPSTGCAYARYTATGGETWSAADAAPSSCNGSVALTGLPDLDPAAPGFPLDSVGADATIELSWDSQGGAESYQVRCWTANLPSAGTTPLTHAPDPGPTQTATVADVENYVTHRCEVDAVTSGGQVTSTETTVVPHPGDPVVPTPPPGSGPGSLPPSGSEPAPPSNEAAPVPGEGCGGGDRCVTPATSLRGLASFMSTAPHGNHILYTVDIGANRVRAVVDTGATVSSTYLIEVLDAAGATVDLSSVTDLVTGPHPSRSHPDGGHVPHTVLYAVTSGGDVLALSPVSGSSRWRSYPVASGIPTANAVTYDNCPTAPGSAGRAHGSHCLHVATTAGIVIVPLTATGGVEIEEPWAPMGPPNLRGLVSNTADLSGGDGPGAWFGTDGTEVRGFHWDGTGPYHRVRSVGVATGVATLDGQLYFTRTDQYPIYRNTSPPPNTNAAKVHIAGQRYLGPAVDGAGLGAAFTNPTRLHWHGNPDVLYVLDGPCVRRFDVASTEVRSLVCPAEWDLSNLYRTDTSTSVVAAPGGPSSSPNLGPPASHFSSDGTVAYFTTPQQLTDADTSNDFDLYRKDMVTGDVTLITTGSAAAGANANAVTSSPDGSRAAYLTGDSALHLYDHSTGTSTLLHGPTPRSMKLGKLSPDGTRLSVTIANGSPMPDGVDAVTGGISINFDEHVYVADLTSGTWVRASTNSAGVNGADGSSGYASCTPSGFSADNSKVAFTCSHTNLIPSDTNGGQQDLFVKDLVTGEVVIANTDASGAQSALGVTHPHLHPDGTKAMFASASADLVPGDTNDATDIFVKDLASGAVTRLTAPGGVELTHGADLPAPSPNWQKVAFVTNDTLAWDNPGSDVFIADLSNGSVSLVSYHAGGTGGWTVSGGDFGSLQLTERTVSWRVYYSSQARNHYLAHRFL